MSCDEICIDVRADGIGVVYNGKAEVWSLDLEACMTKLRPMVLELQIKDNSEVHDDCHPVIGFPWHQFQIHRVGQNSFAVHLGYWLDTGVPSAGGISAIWPRDVDEVLTAAKTLLELLHRHPDPNCNRHRLPLAGVYGLDRVTW